MRASGQAKHVQRLQRLRLDTRRCCSPDSVSAAAGTPKSVPHRSQQALAVAPLDTGAAGMAHQLHSVLRVSQSGSIVQLQPFRGQDVDGDTLSIDLATGNIRLQKRVRALRLPLLALHHERMHVMNS